MLEGRRSAWRLKVHVPDLESVDQRQWFAWVRDWAIPACLNAPFQLSLELVPPDDGVESEGQDPTE